MKAIEKNGLLMYCSVLCIHRKGHLSSEGSANYPSYVEMCTKLPLK